MKNISKTKSVSLTDLIVKGKFDYVNSNITAENFPSEPLRSSGYKLYHFDRSINSEDAIKEIEKEGYSPANLYELLSWDGWNGKDLIVALGSSYVLYGSRYVPYLYGWYGRRLRLSWWDGGWDVYYRFLAVRT